jgi:hypothetical protein
MNNAFVKINKGGESVALKKLWINILEQSGQLMTYQHGPNLF